MIYRYGRFVYEGPVITEPVLGLEYLPGVLQGIRALPPAAGPPSASVERSAPSRSRAHTAAPSSPPAEAVQGQIPYVSEVRELPADGAPMLALAFVVRARRSVTARSSARGPRLCAPIHGHAHAPVALRQLTPQRLHRMLRASQDRALQVAFEELGSRLEGKLGALVASGEHDWLEDEDSALYFELETLPGYSCNVSGASGCAALAAASAARWWRR